MEARELRVGNYYICPLGEQETVLNIGYEGINESMDGMCIELLRDRFEDCSPIQLTEDWLLKFGFDKSDNLFRKGHMMISIDNLKWFYRASVLEFNKIQFVHQLQNLYFALTNEELTLNTD